MGPMNHNHHWAHCKNNPRKAIALPMGCQAKEMGHTLTHWCPDKMAYILQMTFSVKRFFFILIYWYLFLRIQEVNFSFKIRLGAWQVRSHYLHLQWNGIIILMKFSLLAAPDVVIWQCPVHPVMKISSKWLNYFSFSVWWPSSLMRKCPTKLNVSLLSPWLPQWYH